MFWSFKFAQHFYPTCAKTHGEKQPKPCPKQAYLGIMTRAINLENVEMIATKDKKHVVY